MTQLVVNVTVVIYENPRKYFWDLRKSTYKVQYLAQVDSFQPPFVHYQTSRRTPERGQLVMEKTLWGRGNSEGILGGKKDGRSQERTKSVSMGRDKKKVFLYMRYGLKRCRKKALSSITHSNGIEAGGQRGTGARKSRTNN